MHAFVATTSLHTMSARKASYPPGEPTIQIVFSFLSPADISRAACTCREWHRILAHKTPCLRFVFNLRQAKFQHLAPNQLMQSIFKPHIVRLCLFYSCSPETLCTLRQLTNLVHLECAVHITECLLITYTLPPKLITLKIDIDISEFLNPQSAFDQVNAIMIGIVHSSPNMQHISLNIYVSAFSDAVKRLDFLPFLRLTELKRFVIRCFTHYNVPCEPFLPSLAKMIQMHPSLEHISLFWHECDDRSRDLTLRTLDCVTSPAPLCLKSIELRSTIVDDSKMAALCKLSTLTHIQPRKLNVSSLDCMSFFPQCTSFQCITNSMSCSVMVMGLRNMTQLEYLTVSHWDLTSQFLHDIVSCLPRLKGLMLLNCNMLNDLQWVKALPSHCLTRLVIQECPNVEVADLLELKHFHNLSTLIIDASFNTSESNELPIELLTPPSVLLPSLKTLHVADEIEEDENDGSDNDDYGDDDNDEDDEKQYSPQPYVWSGE